MTSAATVDHCPKMAFLGSAREDLNELRYSLVCEKYLLSSDRKSRERGDKLLHSEAVNKLGQGNINLISAILDNLDFFVGQKISCCSLLIKTLAHRRQV